MFETIKKTLDLLSAADKKKSIFLLLLMGVQAGLEVGALGLIMPFISLAADPAQISQHQYLKLIYDASPAQTTAGFLMAIGGGLVFLIIFKNFFQTLLLAVQSRFLVRIQLDVERRLMGVYLMRGYLFHVQKNPAELYQNMRSVSAIINLILSPLFQGITELIVLSFVLVFLVWLRPLVTLAALCVLGGIMLAIYLFVGKSMRRTGELAQRHATAMDQWMMQSFGGIKEIKILGKEQFFLEKTLDHSSKYASATFRGQVMQQISRPLIESIGFSIIIISIIFHLAFGDPSSSILPTLILFVAAAFRLMPALNRIIGSMLTIRQGTSRVDSVVKELGAVVECDDVDEHRRTRGLHLSRQIELKNITYSYPSAAKPSLNQLSLSFKKGESVAFVGQSGAGKTTIVDLLLGLLPDYEGDILVDDIKLSGPALKQWRRNFGYIPQTIYLSDDTIRRNIAFGLSDSEIDDGKVARALSAAQLEEVVTALPEGLDTMVGDRGVRLSGGQRQRIGIARALYNDPEILILDEATSALDNETERAVSSAISHLSGVKTIILIAHRLSTVVHCDHIFFIENGQIEAQGRYSELLEQSQKFKEFAGPH